MSIHSNLISLLASIPENVKLVAVSKTKPVEDILEAYKAGQRIFGENKAQDVAAKQPLLPDDIEWHFIGHMQTNKVKYIAPFISLFHGVDSLKILKEFNKQALKNDRVIDCLLQFHIAEEESKFGLSLDDAEQILADESFRSLQNVRIIGVMGMSTFTDDEQQIRREFRQLKQYFEALKDKWFAADTAFEEISMGMSGDYRIAIEEGSTMVRVGTSIFGQRY